MANPEQIAALKAAFAPFDSDEVGAVSAPLLAGLIQKLGQEAPPLPVLEGFIAAVDAEKVKVANFPRPATLAVAVGPKKDGESHIMRALGAAEGLWTHYPPTHQCRTLWESFQASVQSGGDRPCLGTRIAGGAYSWQTYAQVSDRAKAIGSGLRNLCNLQEQHNVGIMMKTKAEWTITELALFSQRAVTVTLYETFGVESMTFICNQAELSILFIDGPKLPVVIEMSANAPNVKYVITHGPIPEGIVIPANLTVIAFEALEANGVASPVAVNAPRPDDLFLICYTSGTTGMPKGATHVHSAMVACAGGGVKGLQDINNTDVHFGFLPLAHIMEQYLEAVVLQAGAAIAFWQGDVLKMMEDVAECKPTIFIGVPRVLNRLYGRMRAGLDAADGMKKVLIGWAMESKSKTLAKGRYRSFWDLIVFRPLAAALGGRVRMVGTGSAPIDPEMLRFFRLALSCPVVEGYGMTEVLVTNGTRPWDTLTSYIGPVNEFCEVKLVDVPDMNYLSTDKNPRGEICFRGPMNTRGYYKNPELTAQTIDADGFLHTGDVGEFLPDGNLKIIDRKKHLFKLAQGEYVAPEKLEQLYIHCKFIAQIFVNGDAMQSSLVAVVVPNPDAVPGVMAKLNIASPADLITSDVFKTMILNEMDDIANRQKLMGFEKIKAVHVLGQSFEDLGLLTPTFKLKRNEARIHFKDTCNAMYAALAAQPSNSP